MEGFYFKDKKKSDLVGNIRNHTQGTLFIVIIVRWGLGFLGFADSLGVALAVLPGSNGGQQ